MRPVMHDDRCEADLVRSPAQPCGCSDRDAPMSQEQLLTERDEARAEVQRLRDLIATGCPVDSKAKETPK